MVLTVSLPKKIVVLYFCSITLLSMSNEVSSSCGARQKPRSKLEQAMLQYPLPTSPTSGKLEIETGLEFLIREDASVKVDTKFFFSNDKITKGRRSMLSTLQIVQTFIRNIKGFPTNNLQYEGPLGISHDSNKPEWCCDSQKLRNLVPIEIRMYHILKRHSLDYYYTKPFLGLESYLKDIEETTFKVITSIHGNHKSRILDHTGDPYSYIAAHPLLMYRMIRRFVEDLPHILSYLESQGDLVSIVNDYVNPDKLVLPNSQDLQSALRLVSYLQHENELKAFMIGRGILGDSETGIQLNVLNGLELGAFHFDNEDFDYAVQWYRFAYQKLKENPWVITLYPETEKFCNKMYKLAVDENTTSQKTKIRQITQSVVTETIDDERNRRNSSELSGSSSKKTIKEAFCKKTEHDRATLMHRFQETSQCVGADMEMENPKYLK